MDLFWIAVFLLPFIGALHRYGVSYGYRGVSRAAAWHEAWRVGFMLAMICGLFAVAHLYQQR